VTSMDTVRDTTLVKARSMVTALHWCFRGCPVLTVYFQDRGWLPASGLPGVSDRGSDTVREQRLEQSCG
jgi:hypothetical protein